MCVCVCVCVCVCTCTHVHSVVSSSLQPHGPLLCPWDFPGKNIGVVCYVNIYIHTLYIHVCVYIYTHTNGILVNHS